MGIQYKGTNVSGKIPSVNDIDKGELFINSKDEVLFTKNESGDIIKIGSGTPLTNVGGGS